MVVLGAGPAGLAAAWRAARRGLSTIVLERGTAVGGMAASLEVAGQRVDLGSHRLHPATPAPILAALEQLLGSDLQRRPRNGRIVLRGHFVRFPLTPADLVANLPRPLAAELLFDAARAPFRRSRSDTYADVIRAGLGPAMLREFYGPYARKLWGVEPQDLAGELARRRVTASSPARIAQRLLRSRREPPSFFYPRLGFGQISEALAEAAVAAGATIRLGPAGTVTAVGAVPGVGIGGRAGSAERDEDPWPGPTVPGGAGRAVVTLADGSTVEGGLIFSTVPITVLAGLLGCPRPGSLDFRGMALVYLAVSRPRYTDYDAHYLPDPGTVVSRLSEPKNYRTGPDPGDQTVLCAEVPCTPGDHLWMEDDERLAERVADEIAYLGLPVVGRGPLVHHVVRLPCVYPVYRRGFAEQLVALESAIGAHSRVVTFGRSGLFTPDNTHHALAMAWAAVDAVRPDGSFDRATWAAARAGFRRHVVED